MKFFNIPFLGQGISNTTLSKYQFHYTNVLINSKIQAKKYIFFFIFSFSYSGTEGVDVVQQINANVVTRDGEDYLEIESVKVEMTLQKMSIDLKDNLNENVIVGTFTQVLNENWRDIFNELKPDFEKSIGNVIKLLIAPVFHAIPYRSLFAEWNS